MATQAQRRRPKSKAKRASAHDWRVRVNLAKRNTTKGRAARREIFQTFLQPAIGTPEGRERWELSRKFIATCLRKLLAGGDASDVFACGVPVKNLLKARDKKLARAQMVCDLIANGKKQHVAIKTVAQKYEVSPDTVRDDLALHARRKEFEKEVEKNQSEISASWLAD